MKEHNITIFLPMCREHRVDVMALQVAKLKRESININIVIVVDNSNITKEFVIDTFQYRLPGIPIKIYHTGNAGSSEFSVGARRQRITDVFTLGAKYIPPYSELVFTIEDDTDLSSNALEALLWRYMILKLATPNIGLVSGIQVGRWGFKIIGAWKADNPANLQSLKSVEYKNTGNSEEVDATGFYCFITPRELFCTTPFHFLPFGPDVHYGLDLKLKGYKNFVDWSVITGHNDNNYSLRPDEKCVVIKFQKNNDIWNHEILKNNIS